MSKIRKGDFFTIDVEAFLADKLVFFRDWKLDLDVVKETKALKGKTFQVHRIEHGTTVVYNNGIGFTGVKEEFCRKFLVPKTQRKKGKR